MFLLGHLLVLTTDSLDCIYCYDLSPARHNFLIISTSLILPCWLLSHFFHWLHNHLDIGVVTSGAKYNFGEKRNKEIQFFAFQCFYSDNTEEPSYTLNCCVVMTILLLFLFIPLVILFICLGLIFYTIWQLLTCQTIWMQEKPKFFSETGR